MLTRYRYRSATLHRGICPSPGRVRVCVYFGTDIWWFLLSDTGSLWRECNMYVCISLWVLQEHNVRFHIEMGCPLFDRHVGHRKALQPFNDQRCTCWSLSVSWTLKIFPWSLDPTSQREPILAFFLGPASSKHARLPCRCWDSIEFCPRNMVPDNYGRLMFPVLLSTNNKEAAVGDCRDHLILKDEWSEPGGDLVSVGGDKDETDRSASARYYLAEWCRTVNFWRNLGDRGLHLVPLALISSWPRDWGGTRPCRKRNRWQQHERNCCWGLITWLKPT